MILPEVISYLLTLRYPGSQTGRGDFVCYQHSLQVAIPMIMPGQDIIYTVRPYQGVYAMIVYMRQIGTDMVPNTFVATVQQFGAVIHSNAAITQVYRDGDHPGFVLITEQEPITVIVSNISPLVQRGEMDAHFVLIPSPTDLETVTDALRRLHTSKVSEEHLQQAAHLLGVISQSASAPLPPVGGS